MSNTNNSNKIKISKLKYFYFILVLSILLISGTYAYQYITTTNSNATGMGGCFNVNYTGENITTSSISTTTNYEDGSKTTVTLSKNSSCKLYTEANIYLHTNNTTTAPIETIPALKYKLYNGSSQISEGTITNKNDYLLGTVPLTDTSTTYTVYLYIDPSISIGNYNGTSYSGYIYADSHQTSTIEGNYLVSFDRGNLLYGLEDTNGEVAARGSMTNPNSYIDYSINDDSITVTNNGTQDDGYGLIEPTKINLEKGKTYIFNCDTDGTWGGTVPTNTVEAFLGLDGSYTTNIRMASNNYEFTPSTSGTYWLRLDVNQSGQTHTFSNISITEKESSMQTKTITSGQPYGWLPTPSKPGYTFKGWNGKNLFNYDTSTVWVAATSKQLISGEKTFVRNPEYYSKSIWPIFYDNTISYTNSTSYTMSFDIWSDSNLSIDSTLYINDATSTTHNLSSIESSKKRLIGSYVYNNPSSQKILHIYPQNIPNNCNVYISNVQIEQGPTATTYEPFYVTSDTTVTQDKNHTLTAIWEKNN